MAVNVDPGLKIFSEMPFGRAALNKMAPLPDDFFIYSAGWLGTRPDEWLLFKVVGARFRVAKRGSNAGRLSIMVPGTKRSVLLTREEMAALKTEGEDDETQS